MAADIARANANNDVASAAGEVRRYFAVAFPLHLLDEDELIVPSLRGRDDAIDQALHLMQTDHADHAKDIAHLIELCAALEAQPSQLAVLRDDLAASTAKLASLLEPHLRLEETQIFPALRLLPRSTRDELRAAIRARRASAL